MKVAIFGASGFVGTNVIEALKATGHEIIASDIQEKPIEGTQFVKANLLKYEEVETVVSDCDIVIHLAANPLNISVEKPRLNAQINIDGTLNIMDASREYGIKKVIFSSASSLVGEVRYNPVDEKHPCTPKTPYGVAKYAIEHYLRVYQELYGLNYLVFRFFNIYGPWQYPTSGALIPMVYNKLSVGEAFNVFGTGSQMRDFVYVGDIADYYVRSVSNDVKNTVVNMGTGRGTTIKDVVLTAGEVLGVEPGINYLPERPGEIDNFVADTSRIAGLFGGAPSTNLKDGMKATFSWLRSLNQW